VALPVVLAAGLGLFASFLGGMDPPFEPALATAAIERGQPAVLGGHRFAGAVPDHGQYVGVSSCAAANCHGGTIREVPFDRNRFSVSAYSVWVQKDRHADAYSVLFGPKSKGIYRRLGLDRVPPQKVKLCLNCHTVNTADRRPTFTQEDGVSCENCHGPAGGWLAAHSRADWESLTADQKAEYGMRNLRGDLRVRAQVCVDCHVGSPDKEVSHDLIAAGHPRLMFELAGYHDLVPRHWDDGADREAIARATGNSFDAELWIVGQLVSARAAARLCRARAEQVPQSQGFWPELAEYDCYACHHNLIPAGWRQELRRIGNDQSKPGMLRPNLWYFSMIDPISRSLFLEKPGESIPSLAAFDRSRRSFTARLEVGRDAARLEAFLDESLERLRFAPSQAAGRYFRVSADQIRTILAQITDLKRNDVTDWDSVAQVYLAAVALERVVENRPKMMTAVDRRQAMELLKKTAYALAFPKSMQSPSEAEWSGLEPGKSGKTPLEQLDQLHQWLVGAGRSPKRNSSNSTH
jgi:Cytochrome c554 and c-prime